MAMVKGVMRVLMTVSFAEETIIGDVRVRPCQERKIRLRFAFETGTTLPW
jgi:hypothetical protein